VGNLLFGVFPLFFLGLVYFRLDIPYLNEDAAFYYSFGAYLALLGFGISEEGKSLSYENTKKKSAFSPSLLLLSALLCYGYTVLGKTIGLLLLTTVLYRISTAIFLLLLCQRGFFAFGKKYADHNFYLYAVHYLFLRLWFMLQKYLFPEAGEALLFCFYTLSPLYCLFLSQVSGYFLKKHAQVLWKLVNGGRV